jgi:hypothetical protein
MKKLPDREELKLRRFILHSDSKHGGKPLEDEEGNIIGSGALGAISVDNVYLTTYAEYPTDVRPYDLKVGACIEGVEFRLSGELGVYDIYRVK